MFQPRTENTRHISGIEGSPLTVKNAFFTELENAIMKHFSHRRQNKTKNEEKGTIMKIQQERETNNKDERWKNNG